MTRGIDIPLSLNPAKLIRGMRLTEREFDDLADELRDTARAGDRLEDDLESNFRVIGDRAERAGRDIDDGIRSGAGRVGSVGAEYGDEFVESWGEAVRSGDPAEAVGETLTNSAQLLSILGPAGTIAGLGLAAGAGFVRQFMDKTSEEVAARGQAVKDAVANLFDTAVDAELSGKEAGLAFLRGYTDATEVPQAIADALDIPLTEALDKVQTFADQTGLSVGTVGDALLGNRDAAALVLEQLALQTGELDSINERITTSGTLTGEARDAAIAQRDALTESVGALDELLGLSAPMVDELDQNNDRWRTASELIDAAGQKTSDYTVKVKGAERPGQVLEGTWSDIKDQIGEAGLKVADVRRQIGQIPREKTITVYVDYVPRGRPPKGVEDRP